MPVGYFALAERLQFIFNPGHEIPQTLCFPEHLLNQL